MAADTYERVAGQEVLRAPFPWFGGKSRCAAEVWAALGDVANYVEPFAGSLAVLLARPTEPKVETVNDLDRFIVNFWRALQAAPDEVARWVDWPANESDLLARHIWLVNTGAERIARLEGDPDFYDTKVAGWWVWGVCIWVCGGGWCSGKGPWTSVDGKLVRMEGAKGVNWGLVHLGHAGRGVSRRIVHLGSGEGVNRQGVTRRLVHLGSGQGVQRQEVQCQGNEGGIYAYLRALADRLRYVRVCCGDWTRVVTDGALSHGASVGIFLDPPYDQTLRNQGYYRHDAEGLSAQVREWAIAHGHNPRYRIVLAGYEGEHEMPDDWRVVKRVAGRAYGRTKTEDNGNRFKERLWLSPHCLDDRKLEMRALL